MITVDGLKQRVTAWRSTSAGVAIGGVVMYAVSSLGCTEPRDWRLWAIGLAAAMPGILAKPAPK